MEKELRKIMADNIQFQLDVAGKSQREMCKALNFKENTVSDWLNAKTYPRIDKIEMMANYFGCKKSDLIEKKNVSNVLTPQERELLADFRSLNPQGKDAVSGLVKAYTLMEQYKLKNATSESLSKGVIA